MKQSALIVAITALILGGCRSGDKHDTVYEGPIETVSTKAEIKNARETVDWAGVYEGKTPCKDCDAIKTTVKLNNDNTFSIQQVHEGKEGGSSEFQENGQFSWEEDGSRIVLKTNDLTIKFQVGEDDLTLLDMSGNILSKKLGNFYILRKQ